MDTQDKFGLSKDTIKKICQVFQGHPEIETALIYGSRAMGTFRNGSDIDLTLLGPNLSLSLLFKLESEIDDLLIPYKVDLSVYQSIDNPDLTEHIQRVGKEFYKKPF